MCSSWWEGKDCVREGQRLGSLGVGVLDNPVTYMAGEGVGGVCGGRGGLCEDQGGEEERREEKEETGREEEDRGWEEF